MSIAFLIIANYCDTCIRSEARRPDVKWHLYILPDDFSKNVNFFSFFACHFWWAKRKILCEKYISYIFHVFSEARDHILILYILFFNKLRQIIPEIRSERRDLLILKWQTNKKGKEINIFKSLARSNVFSTKSEEQEVNLVWPILCIF
jgi:hypothetical protein